MDDRSFSCFPRRIEIQGIQTVKGADEMTKGWFAAAVVTTLLGAFAPPATCGAEAFAQGGPQVPADTLRLGMEDAVRLALENNEDIGIARADLERARGRKKEATAAALPYLDFRGAYTRNILRPVIFFSDPATNEVLQIEIGEDNDYRMDISLSQVLFAFGRVGQAIDAAEYYLRANEEGLEATKSDVELATRTAYLEAVLANEVRAIAAQSLEAAQAQLEETTQKLNQQVASRFDSILAAVEVKNREPAVLSAVNEIRLTRLNLKRIWGVDRDTPIALTDSLVFQPEEYSLEEAIEEAYRMRSDIQSLRFSVAMTEKIYQVRRRSNFPYLSLEGNYAIQGQSSEKFFPDSDRFAESLGIGVSLTFPIFDGFQNRGRAQQARADVTAAEYSLRKLENVVALALAEIHDQLAAERQNLESQRATVGMAEEAYRLARVRFANGLSTSLELKDAELALTNARLNFQTAVFRYMVAKERFEYAMGH
jgi:outer membrane protein